MKTNLKYITYQSFPSETANSLQTITNILEMAKQGNDIELIFPDREKNSSDNINKLKNFYNFDFDLKVRKLPHNLPFGKSKRYDKLTFHISHFLWAKKAINQIENIDSFTTFITRSDWVFYFLSKNGFKVIFECHKPSKLRNIILRRSLKKMNSKIIFLNKNLYEVHKKYITYKSNATILSSGYRDDLFNEKVKKISNQVIFAGQLLRFGSTRNIDFLISCFEDEKLKNFELKIVGGPNEYIKLLKSERNKPIPENVHFLGRLNHKDTIKIMLESEIGILINNENNHSKEFTSPLKYFEYFYNNQIDSQSKEKITYFKENIEELNNFQQNSTRIADVDLVLGMGNACFDFLIANKNQFDPQNVRPNAGQKVAILDLKSSHELSSGASSASIPTGSNKDNVAVNELITLSNTNTKVNGSIHNPINKSKYKNIPQFGYTINSISLVKIVWLIDTSGFQIKNIKATSNSLEQSTKSNIGPHALAFQIPKTGTNVVNADMGLQIPSSSNFFRTFKAQMSKPGQNSIIHKGPKSTASKTKNLIPDLNRDLKIFIDFEI